MYYAAHLDTVPITGRTRFINISKSAEKRLGKQAFDAVAHSERANITTQNKALIESILKKLSATSGIPEFQKTDWKVLVLNNAQPNAFVLPGGYCVVYSGIFPLAKTVDGLACVLSHEAAHVLARHGSERVSKSMFLFPFAMLISSTLGIPIEVVSSASKLLMELPNSRLQESEADEIGAVLMARSCIYDPNAAPKFWKRFREAVKESSPELLSTHPSSERRERELLEMMNKMEEERAKFCKKPLRKA